MKYHKNYYKKVLNRKIVILILTSSGYEGFNEVISNYLQKFDFEFYFYSYSEEVNEIKIKDHNILKFYLIK